METNQTNIDKDTLQIVLNETLEEQKLTNQAIQELITEVKNLKNEVDAFEEKLGTIRVNSPAVDTSKIELSLESGIDKMRKVIEFQPKNVINEKRIVLFPDFRSPEHYKVVIGPILLFILMLVIVTYGYWLIRDFHNN